MPHSGMFAVQGHICVADVSRSYKHYAMLAAKTNFAEQS